MLKRQVLRGLLAFSLLITGLILVGAWAKEASAAGSFKFDFGPGPVSSGYTGAACTTAYNSNLGYGFASLTGVDGRDRNTSDSLRRDFCFGSSLSYKVDLPNGNYNVKAIVGDASAGQSGMNVSAEGQLKINGLSAAAGSYVENTFSVTVADGQMNLDFTGSPARINALEITSVAAINSVTLRDNGDDTVTLQNGKATIVVGKSTASISAIRYNGSNVIQNLGTGGYLANYSINGTSGQKAISGATYSVVSQSSSKVELSFLLNNSSKMPFYLDVRMVMEADSPGFYYYTIYKYTSSMPSGLKLDQLRYAFRPTSSIFKYYAIDDIRKGTLPTPSEMASSEAVQDATEKFPDGSVYTKYQQISNLEGDSRVFGLYGDSIGMSIIEANKDYFVGGPTKQELTAHATDTDPVLLWHDYTSHYGDTNLSPIVGWQKIYGPFYLYINEGSGLNTLWNDAKAKASTEQAKWPYSWISDPLYAASTRGSVTGKLAISDGSSPNGAWVILGAGNKDWQLQNTDYLYYARAASDGTFTIPAVRPGTYTLYSFVNGVLDEYRKNNVAISASTSTNLGTLSWVPKKNGSTLWQIGTPNRSSSEFFITAKAFPTRIPGSDKFRQFGTWYQYPLEFPNGVDYKVGVDNPAVDWNYYQPAIKTPGDPTKLLVPQDTTPTVWKIRFDSSAYTSGTGTLTFGIAGSVYGSLLVKLNGTEIGRWTSFGDGPPNDGSLYRQASRGIYHQVAATFKANLIISGENVIELSHPNVPIFDAFPKYMTSNLYDVIRMEVAP